MEGVTGDPLHCCLVEDPQKPAVPTEVKSPPLPADGPVRPRWRQLAVLPSATLRNDLTALAAGHGSDGVLVIARIEETSRRRGACSSFDPFAGAGRWVQVPCRCLRHSREPGQDDRDGVVAVKEPAQDSVTSRERRP